jgi:hypothetical protein
MDPIDFYLEAGLFMTTDCVSRLKQIDLKTILALSWFLDNTT